MTEPLQGTPEWATARLGRATASRIADALAKTRTGWGASRANYAAQLVAERLTGEVQESYSNAAMKWGTETEPEAKSAYEFRTNSDVVPVGFIPHPKIQMSGASPDGLIGDAGLLEIKCPNTATHIDTLLGQSVPGKYLTQIQWQLACTGRQWCDFVSYDPRMPESMRFFVKRMERHQSMIDELEREVITFLAEVQTTVERLQALCVRRLAA